MGTFGITALVACLACVVGKYLLAVSAVSVRKKIEQAREAYKKARKEEHLSEQRVKLLDAQTRRLEQKRATLQKSLHHLEKAQGDYQQRDAEEKRVRTEQEQLLRQLRKH